jgi:hypothetical protein
MTNHPNRSKKDRALAARLSYVAGPLGVSVLLDGKPFGSIKNHGEHGWQVRVPTLNAAKVIQEHGLHKGMTVFRTLSAAKAAVVASVKDSA